MAARVVGAGVDSRGSAFLNNCLRALVVHPEFSAHAAVENVVAKLAEQQTMQGDWGKHLPFYQTLNALSHLDTPGADAQCQRAITRIGSSQNADGSWGRTEKQWCTFLTVHALKSKGLL